MQDGERSYEYIMLNEGSIVISPHCSMHCPSIQTTILALSNAGEY